MGWKMVYNFLGKDEKAWRNLYLLSLKISLWRSSQTLLWTVTMQGKTFPAITALIDYDDTYRISSLKCFNHISD